MPSAAHASLTVYVNFSEVEVVCAMTSTVVVFDGAKLFVRIRPGQRVFDPKNWG